MSEMVSLDVDEVTEPSNERRVFPLRKDYVIGLLLLLVVVFLWTSSNFVTQALFQGGYHKPFLVTYLNTSSFALYLLPFFARHFWRKFSKGVDPQDGRAFYEPLSISEHEITENPPLNNVRFPYVPTDATPLDGAAPALQPLTTKETAHLALLFCFLWFIANWSVNASLDYTSVASSTILSSTSGFFTLAVGYIFAVESLNSLKVAAVVMSFIGMCLVSLSDRSPTASNPLGSMLVAPQIISPFRTNTYANPLLGDVLALLAAAFYALYVILLKIRIHSESRIDMQLFFGFVGLFNILALFPVGVLLHVTGFEPFGLPSSWSSWGGVLINMFITFSSDYIYVKAMLKTTPLLVTVGLSLTIPLAIIGDAILTKPIKSQAGLGALFVLVGFGLVGWENNINESNVSKQISRREDGHSEPGTTRGQSGDASEHHDNLVD